MAKILNLRERVHQPYRDSLIRTGGFAAGSVEAQTDLFLQTGKTEGQSNLKSGAQLPNDSSFIMLAVRIFMFFRAPRQRRFIDTTIVRNGDIGGTAADAYDWPNTGAGAALGNAVADIYDVYRLYWQASESIFWTVGSGEKDSLKSVPSSYLPAGAGLHGDMGGATDLIHWNNGMPSHASILRIARAITITPRQLIRVLASAQALPDGGNAAAFGTVTAQGRNMLNVVHNLNACDGMAKTVSCTIDGLLSRDVQ